MREQNVEVSNVESKEKFPGLVVDEYEGVEIECI